MRQGFQFEAVNRGALWTKLSLTTAQIAALCGLTTRQVSYWAQKGYLPRSPQNPERFNGNAVDMCVLMKQAMDSGATLSQAAQLAMRYWTTELNEQPQMSNFVPPGLLDIYEKLRSVEITIHGIRAAIEPQIPRVDASVIGEESTRPTNNKEAIVQ